MNYVTLTLYYKNQPMLCFIDKNDYELINQHKWSVHRVYSSHKENFYALTSFYNPDGSRTTIGMHRMITNCPDLMVVDHLNYNGLDNRRSNLEIVTYRENAKRRRPIDICDARFTLKHPSIGGGVY